MVGPFGVAVLRAVALTAAATAGASGHGHGHGPVRLIIDTDMSTDCDDVGAVCIAHSLVSRGEAEILAIVHNTGLDAGVGAVAVLNTYFGRPNIPLGAYKGTAVAPSFHSRC